MNSYDEAITHDTESPFALEATRERTRNGALHEYLRAGGSILQFPRPSRPSNILSVIEEAVKAISTPGAIR